MLPALKSFKMQSEPHHVKTDLRNFVIVRPKEPPWLGAEIWRLGWAGTSQAFFWYDNVKDHKTCVSVTWLRVFSRASQCYQLFRKIEPELIFNYSYFFLLSYNKKKWMKICCNIIHLHFTQGSPSFPNEMQIIKAKNVIIYILNNEHYCWGFTPVSCISWSSGEKKDLYLFKE